MSTNLFGNFSVSINVTTHHYGSGKIFQIRGVIVLNKIVLIIAKSAEIINIFDKLQEIFQEATELLVLYLSAAVLHKQWDLSASTHSVAHPVVEAKHPTNVILGENIRVGENLSG